MDRVFDRIWENLVMTEQSWKSKLHFKQLIRAGVFANVELATNTIDGLRRKGFPQDAVSVICKNPDQREFFERYLAVPASFEDAANPIERSAKIGMEVGGAAALVELVTTGGAKVFVIGSQASVVIAGSLAALMIVHGINTETVLFYERSVQAGDILVAIEVPDDDDVSKLHLVDETMRDSGAKPLPLPGA